MIDSKYKNHTFIVDADLIDLINNEIQSNNRLVYNDGEVNNVHNLINGNVATNVNLVHTTGDETINGIKTFNSEIQGTCIKARHADLAELYEADAPYLCGTLVCFGGDKEITIATKKANGVISSKPGYILNSESSGLPVALTGRVMVLVEGKVNKFDRIELGNPGVGRVNNDTSDCIAVALQDSNCGDNEISLVLCATRMSL